MPSTSSHRPRTLRNLIIFTVVVLASGWLGYGLDRAMNNPPDQPLGMLLWLVLPLLTVLLLRAFGGDGWRDFGLRPNLAGNLPWYAASLLIYPVSAGVVLGLGALLGLVSAPNFSLGLLLSVFAGGLLGSLFKNIFEEFAWRGYLAPKAHTLGLNAYVEHALVGLIWGARHIPYLLFLMTAPSSPPPPPKAWRRSFPSPSPTSSPPPSSTANCACSPTRSGPRCCCTPSATLWWMCSWCRASSRSPPAAIGSFRPDTNLS